MSEPQGTSGTEQLGGLAHILGIITGFLGPLIIWLMKKDTDSFSANHAKEALNFQITALVGYIAISILTAIIPFLVVISWVGYLAILAVVVLWAIKGYQAADKGEEYQYPFAIRLIS